MFKSFWEIAGGKQVRSLYISLSDFFLGGLFVSARCRTESGLRAWLDRNRKAWILRLVWLASLLSFSHFPLKLSKCKELVSISLNLKVSIVFNFARIGRLIRKQWRCRDNLTDLFTLATLLHCYSKSIEYLELRKMFLPLKYLPAV